MRDIIILAFFYFGWLAGLNYPHHPWVALSVCVAAGWFCNDAARWVKGKPTFIYLKFWRRR